MTKTRTHTPTPWRVFTVFADPEIVTDHPTAHETQSIVQFKGQSNAKADAEFIVRACNTFDSMLAALTMQQMADWDPEAATRKGYFDEAKRLREAAIALANGGVS